jgi:hypothetical protein
LKSAPRVWERLSSKSAAKFAGGASKFLEDFWKENWGGVFMLDIIIVLLPMSFGIS